MKSRKRLISLLLLLFTIISLVPIPIHADVTDPGNDGGTGETGGVNNGTWNSDRSGYRFAIVDENFNVVSKIVDLTFVNVKPFEDNGAEINKSSRANGTGKGYYRNTFENAYNMGGIQNGKLPPFPMTKPGETVYGHSAAFVEWFMAGKGSSNVLFGGSKTKVYTPRNPGLSSNKKATEKPQPITRDSLGISFSKNELLISANKRAEILKKAEEILSKQSNYSQLQNQAYARARILSSTVDMKFEKSTVKGKDRLEAIQGIEAGNAWDYFNGIYSSDAEMAYLFIKTIDLAFGNGWTIGSGASIDMTEKNLEIDFENAMIFDIKDLIPLDTGDKANEDSYALKILNLVINGQYLFNVTGAEYVEGAKNEEDNKNNSVVSVMVENNYSVVVEPILLLKPQGVGSTAGAVHPRFVYGTVAEQLKFHHANQTKFNQWGGNHRSLLTRFGWRSFFITADWKSKDGSFVVKAKPFDGEAELSVLMGRLREKKVGSVTETDGIAMHIYITEKPEPDKGIFKAVSYYELYNETTGDTKFTKLVQDEIPPEVKLQDFDEYKVVEWFTTLDESSGEERYDLSNITLPISRSGVGATSLTLNENNEKTLHVLFRANTKDHPTEIEDKIPPGYTTKSGNITLRESEVTKAITTMDTSIPGWGKRVFLFEYGDMSGEDIHYCGGCESYGIDTDGDGVDDDVEVYCPGHKCIAGFGDDKYQYSFWNKEKHDPMLEAHDAGGSFSFRMVNNVTEQRTASITGGTDSWDKAEYQTTIWRAEDKLTISSYKNKGGLELTKLVNGYGKTPSDTRHDNGYYEKNILIHLDVSGTDLSNHTLHSYNGAIFAGTTHIYDEVAPHTSDVVVQIYKGGNAKTPGYITTNQQLFTKTPFKDRYNNIVMSNHSAGFMVQNQTAIQYYPYIRMTWQTTGNTNKRDVQVLSEYHSQLYPNDFAEAAWYQENEAESLKLSSNQWSMHARAINATWGSSDPNKTNKVLPGGAMYHLATGTNEMQSKTKVALVTWQTLVEEPERSALAVPLPVNEYSETKANAEHKNYVDNAKLILDNLKIVQWVNADPDAPYAWTANGKALKVTETNESRTVSLNILGLTGVTSSESKYYLREDKYGDKANQGDLDILNTTEETLYYKVFADTSGDVYLISSTNKSSLKDINGDNKAGATKILTKHDKPSTVAAKLTGDAKELNDRTLLITNFVLALERGTGNDGSASWASDGKWYNEAWDGIYVVRKRTTLDVGFNDPKTRISILDPRLTPQSLGKKDLFKSGFVSQFRANDKSEVATGEQSNFIGAFKGVDILLPDMENIYVSKKFYIPNVTVQDLN